MLKNLQIFTDIKEYITTKLLPERSTYFRIERKKMIPMKFLSGRDSIYVIRDWALLKQFKSSTSKIGAHLHRSTDPQSLQVSEITWPTRGSHVTIVLSVLIGRTGGNCARSAACGTTARRKHEIMRQLKGEMPDWIFRGNPRKWKNDKVLIDCEITREWRVSRKKMNRLSEQGVFKISGFQPLAPLAKCGPKKLH